MNRHTYYEEVKALARDVRAEYSLETYRVRKSDLRRIYRTLGIRIDIRKERFKKLRGAYFDDDLGPTVMVVQLPDEPMIFTLGHELKHHLVDRGRGRVECSWDSDSAPIEIGAEIFAAELIFPESDYAVRLSEVVDGRTCVPEDIVRLKHDTGTTLSYAGLAKRAEFLRLAPQGAFAKVRWKALEEAIFGEPSYKRIQRIRKSRMVPTA